MGCRHFSQAYASLEYSWNIGNVELCGVVSSPAALDGWNCISEAKPLFCFENGS